MSRDIEDCVVTLQVAWAAAKAEWKVKHPDLPQPFLTCTHRSNAEQEELYAIGRTKPGKKITNARAGQSKHNTFPSLAFDIAFIRTDRKLDWTPGLFKLFAEIITPLGVEWGGDWKFIDRPHFQVPDKKP